MNILYLCPDLGIPVLGRKGAAVHVRELASALDRAGHRVTLVAQMLNKSPWEPPAALDIPVLQVRPAPAASAAVQALKEFNELLGLENSLPGELRRILYNRELAEDLKRRFENDPPDFIYERASLYATAGISVARAFGVPLVLEVNAPLAAEQTAYRATGFGELAAQGERWMLNNADAVLAVSAELRKHILSLDTAPGSVHVLPNGVNAALFHPGKADPAVRRRLKLDGGAVLGFVGGLRPWHGVEILPELLSRLSKRHPRLRLVIAGDGQLRRELESEFHRHGLAQRVTFTGLLPHGEIPAVIRQFDIALAPYPLHDHDFYFSPLKLFEYLACGVPVVAPRLGQIAEVVSDGKTGLLYPAGDLDALVRNCERLLAKPGLRATLGKAGARLVRREFTWDKNAQRVVDLARGLIDTRRS